MTYGLERIAAFLQDVESIYDIVWARDPVTKREITYGEVRLQEEVQFSAYNFEHAEVAKLWEHFRLYEQECQSLLALVRKDEAERPERDRLPVLAAYDLCLKCSHLFNLLDARGAISVTERVGIIGRIRNLTVGVARAYASTFNAQPAELTA